MVLGKVKIEQIESQAEKMTLVEILLKYLKSEGITTVFGIPGGLLHPFFQAVEDDEQLSLVVCRHEQGAAFMADGYARMGKGFAVVAATSGPGATNLLTGVSVAFSDGVPMLVITGQAPTSAMGRGASQETPPEDIDIVGMFRSITKYSAMVTSPERLSHHFRRAIRLAMTGRPGPVHINVPVDLWLLPLDESWFDPITYRPQCHLFDREAVKAATKALLLAKNPMFLVGSGADSERAKHYLLRVVEKIGARVATTPRAKGVFPENHPRSMGVFGFAGQKEAKELILSDTIDLLFTIGASLNETTTFNWNPSFGAFRRLLQLDIDPDRIGRNYPVDIALLGDAGTVLMELYYHIDRSLTGGERANSSWPAPTVEDTLQDKSVPTKDHNHHIYPSSFSALVTPERWRLDLLEVLPDDAIVFSDIGGHMLFNIHYLRIGADQRFILNLGFGSMGHGTVAPIGAAIAEPYRSIVAIIGDACFMMNGMELITAREYQVKVIWIVENNQMHGITWHGSQLVNQGKPMHSVINRYPVSVSRIAEAMGIPVFSVSAPGHMQRTFPKALRISGPSLIEVLVDGSISPPLGDRARTVAGFKNRCK